LRATRLFVRRARPGLYFNRVPSLPATDDGSARPLAEDLGNGSGGSEDITWDVDMESGTPDAGVAPEAARTDGGARSTEAEPRVTEADAEQAVTGLDDESELTEADVAFLTDPPEASARPAGPELGAPEPGAERQANRANAEAKANEPQVGESGRWFRPARPKTGFLAFPLDEQADGAVADPEPRVTAADAGPGSAVATPGQAGSHVTETGATGTTPEAPGTSQAPGTGETAGAGETSTPPNQAPTSPAQHPAEAPAGPAGPPETGMPEAGWVVSATGWISPAGADERPGEREAAVRRRISRRTVLQASLIGGAGVAALPLLALVGGITRTDEQPTNLAFSMNTNWLFGGQYMAGSESAFYDDSNFAPVTIPHTVAPLSWQNWDYNRWQQVWIYRRHFNGRHLLDPHRPGNRILADFDGVMVNASVAINDQVVATHQGGYLPFSAELTGKVTSGDNLLAVIVDSRSLPVPPIGYGRSPASVDFLQPGGIYRDVRLRVLPQVFLADLSAQPKDVLSASPRVDVECTIDSAATTGATGTLLVELFDGPSQIAVQATTVKAGSRGTSTARLSLTGFGPAELWSPDHPKLYKVQATLNFPGLGSHVTSRRIGFRDASFQPEGFFLNGKRLPLFGLNRHQLYPYAGMAMPARVQRRDAEILKNEFNCNMVRCSHYPQSPAFLDACDELGLLVWEEAPGWHNVSTVPDWQDLVVRDVRDMVTRDRSRPSVVIWGTRLNETGDFPGLWAATRQVARELDGSRPSSGAMASHQDVTWNEDVFAYNDYGNDTKTGNVALKPPLADLPYLVTEAVGVVEAEPQHFIWTDPPALLARQAALHGQAQSQARVNTGYAGLLAWAGFDYASLLGDAPDNIKWAGVADGFRIPKPGAAIYQTQGDPAVRPVIVPVFFWEAGGAVPAPAVMIASNCDQLEVFIGGRHVASALPAFDSPLYGGLAHPPFLVRLPRRLPNPAPDLLVQGFLGGQPVTQLQMSADRSGDALGMAADDAIITADGSDATRAVFRAIDAYGNQRRYGSGQVTLTLSGPATLVGDNPFAFGQYGGLGAVWIRSQAGQPGTITLTASHPLLGQAEVQVRSEPAKHASELA
jgi:beta-galactosidase